MRVYVAIVTRVALCRGAEIGRMTSAVIIVF